jgi:hypothetical protein
MQRQHLLNSDMFDNDADGIDLDDVDVDGTAAGEAS